GKVIVVTGASSGIGLASARALARAGARVVLAARSLGKLELVAAELRAEGLDARAVEMDVTDDASVTDAVAAIVRGGDRIDAVVNNAGNGGELGPWSAREAGHMRAMFDVHVFGMERVTRAVLPVMQRQRDGVVVNVASTVGWVPMPNGAAYCAAKAAVLSFTEALRGELEGTGVRAIVFAPPHTDTEAGRRWTLSGPRTFPVAWVGDELVRALRRERPRFLAGASNRALLVLQRISPALATRIMRSIGLRAVAKALPAAP
ncbi:MAG TPA: SDR family NAD(P)-dependent oxidoreductase, partial [Nannocystaceae bacterium]|nr:SDR family NAD(P)-dependent oxidoreductase [Nannocystaceae bacterium]